MMKEGMKKGKGPTRRKFSNFCFFNTHTKYIHTKPTHPLFGAWSLLLIHVRFTPSQGSQRL